MAHDLVDKTQDGVTSGPVGRPRTGPSDTSSRSSLRSSLGGQTYARQLEALSVRGKQGPSSRLAPGSAAQSAATADIATPELLSFVTQSHAIANFQPSTGIGLFDAAYDAARQELAVNVRCAFRFTSGKRQDFPAAEALKKATGVEEWIFAE